MDEQTAGAIAEGTHAVRARARQWAGLAVIALPCAVYSLDLTVLNLAIPAISRDLRPTAAQLLWIVDIYGFVLASFLITMGSLGDRIGRRRLLMIGATLFAAASIFAASCTTSTTLIAARALLGIAGATLAPATLSLIRTMFPQSHERRMAIGVWASGYSAGALVGPAIGGILLESFAWGSVFLIGVPIMLLSIALAPSLLPEYRDSKAGPIDMLSAIQSLAVVLTAIYGIKELATYGPNASSFAGLLASALLTWWFCRRQRQLSAPLIDVRLFRSKPLCVALGTYGLGSFVAFGTSVLVGQYLQLVLGLQPLAAGLWTLPLGAAAMIGSTVAPLLARRVNPIRLMCSGLLVAAVGYFALAWVGEATTPLAVTAIGCAYVFGLTPVFALGVDAIVARAPAHQAGAVAALSETASELCGALGIALLGSLSTAVFRLDLDEILPEEQGELARGTLSALLDTADRLGDAPGSILREAARAAFLQGMHAAAILSGLLLLAAAALILRGLRLANRSDKAGLSSLR